MQMLSVVAVQNLMIRMKRADVVHRFVCNESSEYDVPMKRASALQILVSGKSSKLNDMKTVSATDIVAVILT